MGQFDSPSEAALARIKSENLSSSPVNGSVDKVSNLGGFILEAIGVTGASGGIGFLTALKNLAVNKDEGNLIYFGDALVDDIRCLYRLYKELKQQFDERISSPEFSAVVANATLHITRTNVESRLKRLAHLIANGVKEDDLETESLDDMMRAAVELKESDIILLGEIYQIQSPLLRSKEWVAQQINQKWNHISRLWQEYWNVQLGVSDYLSGYNGMLLMASFARLESLGMIAPGPDRASAASPVASSYLLLPEGKKFYERLKEIAVQQ